MPGLSDYGVGMNATIKQANTQDQKPQVVEETLQDIGFSMSQIDKPTGQVATVARDVSRKVSTDSKKYKGLNEMDEGSLEAFMKKNQGVDANDVYTQMLQQKKYKKSIKERDTYLRDMINKSVETGDPTLSAKVKAVSRTAKLADAVREDMKSMGYNHYTATDDLLIKGLAKMVKPDEIRDYINGENDSLLEKISGKKKETKGVQDMQEQTQQDDGFTMGQAGKIAGGTVAGGAGLYGLGEGLERAGKGLYGLSLPVSAREADVEFDMIKRQASNASKIENEVLDLRKQLDSGTIDKSTFNKMVKDVNNKYKTELPQTAIDVLEERGIVGTQKTIGKKAAKEATDIFQKEINPMLENSKAKVNVQSMIDDLGKQIQGMSQLDPDKFEEYQQAFEELKIAYSDDAFKNMSLKDIQTAKSGLQGRTPQKFFKGKEITNGYRELKAALGSKMKDALHSNISSEFGVDSAKLYKDYAKLDDIGRRLYKEARTSGGKKGGAGTFISSVYETLGTPVTTVGGQGIKKIGQGLKYIPKVIGKTVANVAKGLVKMVKGGSVMTMFEDGSIVPGSPTQVARESMDLNEEYKENPESFYEGKNARGLDVIYRKSDVQEAVKDNMFTDADGTRYMIQGNKLYPMT